MKLSKKIIACMLACILALSMLTACGGGGGGGGTPTSTLKLASSPLAAGKVTLEGVDATNPNNKVKFGTNGTSTYIRETDIGSDEVCLKVNSSIYYIDLTAEEIEAENVSSDSAYKATMELLEAMLNVKAHLSGATSDKTAVNGIEYYSETTSVEISGQKIDFAYCFEGNTLKYIVVINGADSEAVLTIRVDSIKSSVDDNLLTVNGWISTPEPSAKVTISASVTPSNGGTVSGTGTYTVGDSVTLKATPNTGYTFKGWQKNGSTVSTSTSYTFTASESVTLTAVFEKDTVADEIPIDEAHFPDTKFRSYVSNRFDKDNSGGLSESEIAAAKFIEISSSYDVSITSLKGIEYLTSLKSLDCSGNDLTSLDVSNNPALETLDCGGNNLTSLDVSKNTALKDLDCSDNNLTSLDVSKNPKLKELWCVSNNLTSLNVSKNPALTTLECVNNNLTSLDVSKNPALETLECNVNNLTSLDVSKNPALTNLQCMANNLTSLDVSKNPALTLLACSSNTLTSLDISKNPALTILSCFGNKLTSLDVSKNPELSSLDCKNNKLTILDLSANPKFKSKDTSYLSVDDGVNVIYPA